MSSLGRTQPQDSGNILYSGFMHYIPDALDTALKEAGIDPSLVASYKPKVIPVLSKLLTDRLLTEWTNGGVHIALTIPGPTHTALLQREITRRQQPQGQPQQAPMQQPQMPQQPMQQAPQQAQQPQTMPGQPLIEETGDFGDSLGGNM